MISSISSTSIAGATHPPGVNEVARWVGEFLSELGADIDLRPDPDGRFGNTVVATFRGARQGPRVLLIGHMDTVFDPGTVAERPFRVEEGIAYGPGVTDMKSGPARRPVCPQGHRSRARRPAVRAARLRRQPRRGDRLADLARRTSGSSPRTWTRAWCSSAPAPTATSCSARKGILDTRLHRPRSGRPRGRRAREGPQRDPRGRADRRGPARAQRPLAGCDR